MAILINVPLTKGGVIIPAGAMIKAATHFPKDQLGIDENGDWDGTKVRRVTMDLTLYASKTDFQLLNSDLGEVDEFPPGFNKILTDDDWAALSGTNALLTVETWLKEWLEDESRLGTDSCAIIDPYTVGSPG